METPNGTPEGTSLVPMVDVADDVQELEELSPGDGEVSLDRRGSLSEDPEVEVGAVGADEVGELAGGQPGLHGEGLLRGGAVGADHVEKWRVVVLGCAILLFLLSWVAVIGFHALQHLLSIIGCIAILVVVSSTESVYLPGDPRACCNRATCFLFFFTLIPFTCLGDVIGLVYSRITESQGNEEQSVKHYGAYTLFISLILAFELFTVFAGYRLRVALQMCVRLPAE